MISDLVLNMTTKSLRGWSLSKAATGHVHRPNQERSSIILMSSHFWRCADEMLRNLL